MPHCLQLKPIFVLLLGFCLQYVFGQKPHMKNYTVEHGLASSTVYGVYQDKEGYIWFATESGVNRFDGNTFETFTTEDGLPSNTAFSFAEDNRGRLWVSCNNSKPAYFDGKSWISEQTFINPNSVAGSYRNLSFYRYGEDLYFNFGTQVFRLKDDRSVELKLNLDFVFNPNFEKVKPPPGSILLAIREVQMMGKELYLHSNSGVYLAKPLESILIDHWRNYSVLIRSYEDCYFRSYGSEVSYYGIKENNNFLINSYRVQNNIQNIYPTQNDELWVEESDFGLKCLQFDSKGHFSVKYELRGISGLSAAFSDTEGNTWIATLSHGVFKINHHNSIVFDQEQSVKSNAFFSLEPIGDDKILAGNSKGQIVSYQRARFTESNTLLTLQEGRVLKIEMDIISNQILAATDKGIFVAGPSLEFKGINTYPVKTIHVGRNQNYVGYFSVIEAFGKRHQPSRNPKFEKLVKAYSLLEGTNSGELIVGGLTGLEIWRQSDTVHLNNKYPEVLKGRIASILRAPNRRLWVGTHAQGVAILENDSLMIRVIDMKNGMPSNQVQNLSYDNRGYFWVSTNNGLARIDAHTFRVTNYSDQTVLPNNDVNDCLAISDTIWVATANGVAYFKDTVITTAANFQTKFRYLDCEGRKLNQLQDHFVFSSTQNDISLSFAALTYLSHGASTYHYVINKLVPQVYLWTWQDLLAAFKALVERPITYREGVSESGILVLNNLSPGKYLVKVSGVSYDSVESQAPAIVVFQIRPNFIDVIWVHIFFLCLLAYMLFRFFAWRKSVALNELQLKEQLGQLQFEAFKTRINPHFIFNSLNGIQQFFFPPDPVKANKYIELMSKLLRQTMEMSDVHFVSFQEELQYLSDYLQMAKLRLDGQLKYSIEKPDKLPQGIKLPSMILQPLIENAIIHGNNEGVTTLNLVFSFVDDTLSCRVEDDGKGIRYTQALEKNSAKVSKGLQLIRDRVDALNAVFDANISVEVVDKKEINSLGNGTVATLKVKNAHGRFSN
jgi:ligand-binding sensor domain-containing protein